MPRVEDGKSPNLKTARLKCRARWRAATGPMGALTGTLRELGWVGIEPDVWGALDGSEWRFDPDPDADIS
eukprot:3719818-Pyramimonas_sp.AAC.1